MENKELLITMMDFLKNSFGMSDKEISLRAGYAKNYLSVCLSNGKVSDKIIEKVQLKFADQLKGLKLSGKNVVHDGEAPYIRRKMADDKIVIRDGMARMYESQQRMEARQMVMRNFLAEIYAKTFGQPVTKVLDEMGDLEKKAAARLNGE